MQVTPCFILVCLTILILIKLKEVKERRKKTLNKKSDADVESARADQTGSALIAIVILFLICEVPLASLVFATIFDFAIMRNVVLRVLYFSQMLRLLNSSCNFILYCLMSAQFRSEFQLAFSEKLGRALMVNGSDKASGSLGVLLETRQCSVPSSSV